MPFINYFLLQLHKVRSRSKQLRRYEQDWATFEIMKSFLKNKRTHQRRNGSLDKERFGEDGGEDGDAHAPDRDSDSEFEDGGKSGNGDKELEEEDEDDGEEMMNSDEEKEASGDRDENGSGEEEEADVGRDQGDEDADLIGEGMGFDDDDVIQDNGSTGRKEMTAGWEGGIKPVAKRQKVPRMKPQSAAQLATGQATKATPQVKKRAPKGKNFEQK